MELISSDTNVWIDFAVIDRLDLPFMLPYTYIMNDDAAESEMLSPSGMKEALLKLGLVKVELTFEEFTLAEQYGNKYIKLSVFDRIALAIAKSRNITLLTGDLALRKAAVCENVKVIGTIGILDKLYKNKYIDGELYKTILNTFSLHNGQKIRLPQEEIDKRLNALK